ncbi:MAG: metal ABC transporter permease [Proteobacteria bacterium]|nr:metal ABC transporter permease [Pseudomonadota bacterium]
MTEAFFLRALLAGIGVALVAAPLGCFVVWRRMAYFGATLAHSALLGIALGILLGVNPSLGIAASSIAVALVVVTFERQRLIGRDTLLGILAHAGLAIGLVALSFIEGARIDLMAYLFGDILAVGARDLAWIAGGGAAVLAACDIGAIPEIVVHGETGVVVDEDAEALCEAWRRLLADPPRRRCDNGIFPHARETTRYLR